MIVNLKALKNKFYHLTICKKNFNQTQIESFKNWIIYRLYL